MIIAGFLYPALAQNTQSSPLDTQLLPVGELFSLIIRADGESNPPARISADALPEESVLLRNLDGSRTFMWIPRTEDIGSKTIEVTVTDAQDASVSATYPIHFEVVAQLTGGSTQAAATAEQTSTTNTATSTNADKSTVATAATSNDADKASDKTDKSALGKKETNNVRAQVAAADADSDAGVNTPASDADSITPETKTTGAEIEDVAKAVKTLRSEEPLVQSASQEASQTLTQAALSANTKTQTAPEVAEPNIEQPSAATSDDADADSNVAETVELPRLSVDDETVAVQIGKPVRVPIEHSDSTGKPADLNALNLPPLAQLLPVKEGHLLRWLPTESDVGTHVVILVATDSNDSQLRTSRRLLIQVER